MENQSHEKTDLTDAQKEKLGNFALAQLEQGKTAAQVKRAWSTLNGSISKIEGQYLELLHLELASTQKKIKIDPRDFVANWMLEKGYTLECKTGSLLSPSGQVISSDSVYRNLVLDASLQAKIGDKHIDHAFSLWKEERVKAMVDTVRARIAYDPALEAEGMAQLDALLLALTGVINEADKAVTLHFIHQVKTKFAGRHSDVQHHMMPILFGKSGSGKTQTIRKLIEPIFEVSDAPQDLGVLSDSRDFLIFQRNYVLFFDEMARAHKADIAAIKNKITSNEVSGRILGSNRHETIPQNATMIGAIDRDFTEVIKDEQSARRFWVIKTRDKIDWDAINKINFLAIWQSVDETKPSPILAVIDKIQIVQNSELRSKSLLEEWIEEAIDKENVPGQSEKKAWLSRDDAYDAFQTWAQRQNIKIAFKINTFVTQMRNYIEYDKANTGRKFRCRLRESAKRPPIVDLYSLRR